MISCGKFYVGCPRCGIEIWCGCKSCKESNRAKGQITLEFLPDGELEKCGNCGHTMHADAWLDEEVDQMKEAGMWPTLIP